MTDERKGECQGNQEKCNLENCPKFGTLGVAGRDGKRRVKGCSDPAARGKRSRRKGLNKQRTARKRLGVAPSHKFGDGNEERWNDALFANEVLALSYIAEEAGMSFPKPAVIQVDNMAAIAFSKQAQFSGRSKLRHVDCRQQWLQVLRDSNIVKCVHVSSEFNKADIFTKALDTDTFVRLRDTMLRGSCSFTARTDG